MKTLLLNTTYEPITVITWQRAVVLDFLNKIEILEYWENEVIRTTIGDFQMPSVVKLKTYARYQKYKTERFCKKNLFIRDAYTCQYCAKKKPYSELTYDHVLPRSMGGKTTWVNIVACCVSCNQWKGDNTPEQAGMRLIREPFVPKHLFGLGKFPDSWKQFLW